MIWFLLMRLVNDFDQYAESTQCQNTTYRLISARLEKAATVTSHVYEIKLSLLWSTYEHVLFVPSFEQENQQTPNAAIRVALPIL